MERFRGGLAFKAQQTFVSLNFRLESNKEEKHREREVGNLESKLLAQRGVQDALNALLHVRPFHRLDGGGGGFNLLSMLYTYI